MADLHEIVSEIERKLRILVNVKEQLSQENKRLVRENAAMKMEIESLRRTNEELEDKNKKSIIVNALGDEKEIEEGRKLIKALVEEVDKCVSILNSKQIG